MVKVAAYYSTEPGDAGVYHDHDNCSAGQRIPAGQRQPGTADRALCEHCRELGLASPTSSG